MSSMMCPAAQASCGAKLTSCIADVGGCAKNTQEQENFATFPWSAEQVCGSSCSPLYKDLFQCVADECFAPARVPFYVEAVIQGCLDTLIEEFWPMVVAGYFGTPNEFEVWDDFVEDQIQLTTTDGEFEVVVYDGPGQAGQDGKVVRYTITPAKDDQKTKIEAILQGAFSNRQKHYNELTMKLKCYLGDENCPPGVLSVNNEGPSATAQCASAQVIYAGQHTWTPTQAPTSQPTSMPRVSRVNKLS